MQLAQFNHIYHWRGGGRQLAKERENLIIKPWAGEAHQPWLATHLAEGKSDFTRTARGPWLHCPSLLGMAAESPVSF